MNTMTLIYSGLLGLLLGLMLSYNTIKEIIRIQRTPTTAIGALPLDGQVEAVGSAEGETIYSPLTQKACVYWQIRISEKHGSGKDSSWEILDKQYSRGAFYINDGTGKLRILPSLYDEFILRNDVNETSNLLDSFGGEMQVALKKLDIDTTKFLNLNKTINVLERYIEPKEKIYALGEFTTQGAGKSFVISTEINKLIISDHSEKEILGKFYWQVFVNALGIPILIYLLLFAFSFANR